LSRIAAACACHCALILLALSLWFAALYGAVDPPPMMSSTALRACSTQNGFPVTVTAHGTEDWSIWIRAPVCACKPFTVSPPRPMTRPTISLGHSTTRRACPGPTPPETPPRPRPPPLVGSPRSTSSTSATAVSTHPAGPETVTTRSTPSGKRWSIAMCAPDCACKPLIVSPPLPMTRPTRPGGQLTVAVLFAIERGGGMAGAEEAAAAAGRGGGGRREDDDDASSSRAAESESESESG
jgi:hypothetical protein